MPFVLKDDVDTLATTPGPLLEQARCPTLFSEAGCSTFACLLKIALLPLRPRRLSAVFLMVLGINRRATVLKVKR